MQTTIFGFNSSGIYTMGKIKMRCQVGDLITVVTCYVIYTETSYNVLLRRPWIRRNRIMPSTLHQVMKYADEWGAICTLTADQHPFKGVKNYYTDFPLYQGQLENGPELELPNFKNEADAKLESDDDCS